MWGEPPQLDLAREAALHKCLAALAADNLLHSAKDISDGGLAVAAAEATFSRQIGATLALQNDGSVFSPSQTINIVGFSSFEGSARAS